MMNAFMTVLISDLTKLHHSPRDWLQPLMFFIVLIALFGIGLGLEPTVLQKVSPAVIWIAFFITTLLTTETLFRQEQQVGLWEQYVLSPTPLWWLMLSKSWAIWIGACLPLLLAAPLLSIGLQLTPAVWGPLTLSLWIGSPAIVFLAVMGSAMTLTLPRVGLLLCLLLLPLYIPILILGESMALPDAISSPALMPLALLAGISVLCITFIPHATAAALKVAMND